MPESLERLDLLSSTHNPTKIVGLKYLNRYHSFSDMLIRLSDGFMITGLVPADQDLQPGTSIADVIKQLFIPNPLHPTAALNISTGLTFNDCARVLEN